MGNQAETQAVLIQGGSVKKGQTVERIYLVNEDGTPAGTTTPLVTTGTAGATVAKTTASKEPPANSFVPVKFTNGNTAASPTLAFAGGTARAMYCGGAASTAAKLVVAANGIAIFWFDGTILHQLGALT